MSSGRMIRRWSSSSARENAYKIIDETSRLNIHELKASLIQLDALFTLVPGRAIYFLIHWIARLFYHPQVLLWIASLPQSEEREREKNRWALK